MYVCIFFFPVPGGEDVPAAVRLTVHLAGGGVEVQRETKGGATVHTGHAAGTGGSTIVDIIHSAHSA